MRKSTNPDQAAIIKFLRASGLEWLTTYKQAHGFKLWGVNRRTFMSFRGSLISTISQGCPRIERAWFKENHLGILSLYVTLNKGKSSARNTFPAVTPIEKPRVKVKAEPHIHRYVCACGHEL